MQANLGNKIVRAMIVISVITVTFIILKYVWVYIYPFFIILIIASVLHPLVSFIENKWRWPRALATFLVMWTFFCILILGSYVLLSKLIKETLILLNDFPEKIQQLKSFSIAMIQQVDQYAMQHLPFLQNWQIEEDINIWIDKLTNLSMNVLSSILQTSTEMVNSISHIGFVLLFIVIAVYMVTKDFTAFMHLSIYILSDKIIHFLKTIYHHMSDAFTGLVKAQIILTLLSTTLICLGLLLFRTDHVLIMTLIIFIVDFIPYLGIGLIFIPWIFYSFLTSDFTSTIQLSVLYAVVILFRQVTEPKLIGNKIGIHPFVALSILFLGIQLFGVIGFLITPLCLIFISALYRSGVFTLLWDYIQGE